MCLKRQMRTINFVLLDQHRVGLVRFDILRLLLLIDKRSTDLGLMALVTWLLNFDHVVIFHLENVMQGFLLSCRLVGAHIEETSLRDGGYACLLLSGCRLLILMAMILVRLRLLGSLFEAEGHLVELTHVWLLPGPLTVGYNLLSLFSPFGSTIGEVGDMFICGWDLLHLEVLECWIQPKQFEI